MVEEPYRKPNLVEPATNDGEDCLCDRCISLDFTAILASIGTRVYPYSHTESPRIPFIRLATLERLPASNCALCRLFDRYISGMWEKAELGAVSWIYANVTPNILYKSTSALSSDITPICTKNTEDVSSSISTRATPLFFDTSNSQKWFSNVDDLLETRQLVILRDNLPRRGAVLMRAMDRMGFIGELSIPSHTLQISPRSVKPNNVDYSEIKRWIASCHEQRLEPCRLCKPSEVQNKWPLRLIDCQMRALVSARDLGPPCPPYLALSYCWGRQRGPLELPKHKHGKLPDNLPLTIEDSITATQGLGYRYLWIDRYCIDQNDDDDKRQQIHIMSDIYGCAAATIIALAGDPTFGLPGVSTTPRVHQPHVKIGDRTLTWTMDSSAQEIWQSAWNSRAWTYQEAMLSHRRLYFTTRQVIFQCGTLRCEEAIHTPQEIVGWKRSPPIFENITKEGGLFGNITDRVNEYSKRQIGFQADILNGIHGVLSVFAKLRGELNLWGVSMGAASEQAFLLGLGWKLEMPGRRRKGFPTWSWAGWEGVVANRGSSRQDTLTQAHSIRVDIECSGGNSIGWSQLQSFWSHQACSFQTSATGEQNDFKVLLLHCTSHPVLFEDPINTDALLKIPVKIGLDPTVTSGYFFPLDEDVISNPFCLTGSPLRAIGLPCLAYEDELMLVVRETTCDCWVRVGHVQVDASIPYEKSLQSLDILHSPLRLV